MTSPLIKRAARKNIGVEHDDLVCSILGVFSCKSPSASYVFGFGRAAKTVKQNIVLVECGWHANAAIAASYAEAAKLACPSVRVIQIDGRKEEGRNNAWSSADVFCSLSDNIQETFGIVPLEAMAAGLPVVVSDWDGYKDTVRDGIDGFRVKTMAPAGGLAIDLANRHALGVDTYDYYCGYTSSLVAVDVGGVEKAFTDLFGSEELRKKMGSAGRARAQQEYDWKEIIRKYEALWDKQNRIRSAEQKRNKRSLVPGVLPTRLDPSTSFSHYATKTLTLDTRLLSVPPNFNAALSILKKYRNLKMVEFAEFIAPTEEELNCVLSAMDGKPKSAWKSSRILKTLEGHTYSGLWAGSQNWGSLTFHENPFHSPKFPDSGKISLPELARRGHDVSALFPKRDVPDSGKDRS